MKLRSFLFALLDPEGIEDTARRDTGNDNYQPAFDWNVFAKEEEKMKRKKLARLQNLAAAMNYQLTPLA